jgi:hypothetical protein
MTDEPPETPTDPSPPPGPSPAQRARLARAYQAAACRRPDPLAANLGVLTGDLLVLAHGFAEQVPAALAAAGPDPAADPRFARTVELYLKLLRQVDRLAQADRRTPPAADPPSARVRPWREEPRG